MITFLAQPLKTLVNLVEGIFTELVRNCAEVGYFPNDWKVGNLVHIPKGPDKDPNSLKSYRPLTMLCEFSKVLERIIKTKIHELASSPISPANQFGFVSGSSTIHSMLELSRIIDCASDKYVMVIFIDIKGAFDNVRWHRVIERMVEINLPAKLISPVASYFSNRTIVLEAERHKIQKQATRGLVLSRDPSSRAKSVLQGTLTSGVEWLAWWTSDMEVGGLKPSRYLSNAKVSLTVNFTNSFSS
ncbi:hypothetical protein M8J77_024014 [Diaphorina citri]|nr:hypothetical protein M8J77_024014 [Diaphorina citri]